MTTTPVADPNKIKEPPRYGWITPDGKLHIVDDCAEHSYTMQRIKREYGFSGYVDGEDRCIHYSFTDVTDIGKHDAATQAQLDTLFDLMTQWRAFHVANPLDQFVDLFIDYFLAHSQSIIDASSKKRAA